MLQVLAHSMAVVICHCLCQAVQADTDLITEVRAKATAAWEEYYRVYSLNMPPREIMRNSYVQDGEIFQQDTWEIKRTGALFLYKHCSVSTTPSQNEDIIKGINSKYRFELRRSSPDRPYVLSEIVLATSKEFEEPRFKGLPKDKMPQTIWRPGLSVTTFYLVGDGDSWHQLFTQPKYELKITQADRDPDNPERITVQCSFRFRGSLETKASVTLDASMYYLPVTTLLHNPPYSTMCTNSYIRVGSGLPLLKESKWQSTAEPGAKVVCTEAVTLEYDFRPVAESELTLSAFGFPEPFGVEWPKPTPWWLYIGAGTLATVLVLGLVWSYRKWRGAQA